MYITYSLMNFFKQITTYFNNKPSPSHEPHPQEEPQTINSIELIISDILDEPLT